MTLFKQAFSICFAFVLFVADVHAQTGELTADEEAYLRQQLAFEMELNESFHEGNGLDPQKMKITSLSRTSDGVVERVRGEYQYTSPSLKGRWMEMYEKDNFIYCVVFSTNPKLMVMPAEFPGSGGPMHLNPYTGFSKRRAIMLQSILDLARERAGSKKPVGQDALSTITLTPNLNVVIKGIYPDGYRPYWYAVEQGEPIDFDHYGVISSRTINNKQSAPVMITQNNNKTVFIFDHWYCKLETNDSVITLTDKPVTFQLKDFKVRKADGTFTDKSIEESMNAYYAGGMTGTLSLAGNTNGDIIMSLAIEIYKKETKTHPSSVSNRYTIQNYTIENHMDIAETKQDMARRKQQKAQDSLAIAELKRKAQEEEAAYELSIKNSYAKVKQKQNDYKAVCNTACLKVETDKRLESSSTTVSVATAVDAPYDASTGRSYDMEMRDKRVYSSHWVEYQGLKNTCENPVVIYGIRKLKSPAGTIYYEDASYLLKPSDMTDEVIKIEKSYNPDTAEVNSVHYYTQKLK